MYTHSSTVCRTSVPEFVYAAAFQCIVQSKRKPSDAKASKARSSNLTWCMPFQACCGDCQAFVRAGYREKDGLLIIGLEVIDDSVVVNAGETRRNQQDGCAVFLDAWDRDEASAVVQIDVVGARISTGPATSRRSRSRTAARVSARAGANRSRAAC